MELTNIIVQPYLTEKSYKAKTYEQKKYAFIVNKKADKTNIALAFESIFNIQPTKVTTMVRKSVSTRTGALHKGYTKAFKIAYITLPKGKDIAISKKDLQDNKNVAKTNENKNQKPINNDSPITIKEVKDVKPNIKNDVNKSQKNNLSSAKKQTQQKDNKLEK